MKTPTLTAPGRAALGLLVLLAAGCSREARRDRAFQRAEEHFRAGAYEAARIEYDNVLQLEPNHVLGLQQLGRIWLERGAPMRALPFAQRAQALYPDNRDAQITAMQIVHALGRLREARDAAARLLARFPDQGEAIVVLTDVARGEENLTIAEEALRKFPDRGSTAFYLASANIATHRGDLGATQASLQRAVTRDPDSPDARLALGSLLLAAGDPAGAEVHLKRASELAPPRSNARVRYLEFQARHGREAESVAGLKAIVQEAPDFFPAWRCLAQISSAAGRHDEAEAYLAKVFAVDFWNYESRVLQARFSVARGEVAKGISALEQLVPQYPDFGGLRYELGQAYLQNKQESEALAALNHAVAMNPDAHTAMLLWAKLSLRAGEPQRVVSTMLEQLAMRPGLVAGQALLVDALGALGRLDDIVTLVSESLRVAPERPASHHLLGLVLRRQGKLDHARQAFEKTLELAPGSLPAASELIQLDLQQENLASARQRLERHLAEHPKSGALHLLAARVFAAEGRWDESETAAWTAIECGSGDRNTHDLIAHILLAKPEGNPRARVEQMLARKPNDVSALIVAGTVYMHLNEHAKAAAVYEQCLLTKPDTIAALNNIAYLYAAKLNHPERALELATRARVLAPDSADVADTLGWILFNRGDYARALELLTEGAKKLPANPEVQFHFARASQKMGRSEPARAAYQRAAAATVDFEGKAQIKGFLAELEQTKTAND